jgi:hypothetical protein
MKRCPAHIVEHPGRFHVREEPLAFDTTLMRCKKKAENATVSLSCRNVERRLPIITYGHRVRLPSYAVAKENFS